MTINFSEKDIEECSNFANSINTDFYSTRNQWNSSKRIEDNCIGKLGELAVYYTFINKYPDISYPDFKIYSAKQKSWDYDLKSSKFNLHVKSVRANSKYGLSWIFELTDKHIFKNNQPNDYVAFVCLDYINKFAEIKSIIKVSTLHEMELFKKPVLAKLTTKAAVYYDDLKDLPFAL